MMNNVRIILLIVLTVCIHRDGLAATADGLAAVAAAAAEENGHQQRIHRPEQGIMMLLALNPNPNQTPRQTAVVIPGPAPRGQDK